MCNYEILQCDNCGADLEPSQIGLCDACQTIENDEIDAEMLADMVRHAETGEQWAEIARVESKLIEQARNSRRLARKPQDFDTSPLPLFGDSHLQRELF